LCQRNVGGRDQRVQAWIVTTVLRVSYLMQQNAPGQSYAARVQFPEQLAASEIPRPPSVRPLPRVGSQNRIPSNVRSSHHVGDSSTFERTRTSSTGSSGRPDTIGLGYPSTRSPSHGPSPLNPSRRRSSGPQTHRKKDSGENFDASRYDMDDAFDDNGPLDGTYNFLLTGNGPGI
jgi:hypothetical protein